MIAGPPPSQDACRYYVTEQHRPTEDSLSGEEYDRCGIRQAQSPRGLQTSFKLMVSEADRGEALLLKRVRVLKALGR
jgi:hypothetical protein